MTTIYVPCDSAARSVGADEVAEALAAALPDARIIRNGSRGMLWLEPLVEVDFSALEPCRDRFEFLECLFDVDL